MSEPASAPASRAGASAQRTYERRKANNERRVRVQHPHLGGLIVRLRDEPQHVAAWAKGAEGERSVGERLDSLASDSVRVLHDRSASGGRANIDHLVVAPSGVYVIDTKAYTGRIGRRDKGGLMRSDVRLYVGARDRSALLEGIACQRQFVCQTVGDHVPVHPVICFTGGDWGVFTRSFTMEGVLVCWPRVLCKRVNAVGRANPNQVAEIAARLAERFPPA